MSITYYTEHHRNASNTATIIIEKRADKYPWGWSYPLWRVLLKKDGDTLAQRIKVALKNKPSNRTIEQLKQEL
jgi:hypothetical protein